MLGFIASVAAGAMGVNFVPSIPVLGDGPIPAIILIVVFILLMKWEYSVNSKSESILNEATNCPACGKFMSRTESAE